MVLGYKPFAVLRFIAQQTLGLRPEPEARSNERFGVHGAASFSNLRVVTVMSQKAATGGRMTEPSTAQAGVRRIVPCACKRREAMPGWRNWQTQGI